MNSPVNPTLPPTPPPAPGHLTVDELLRVLQHAHLIDEPTARASRVREPAQRARLFKARSRLPGRFSDHIPAIELLGSLELTRLDGSPLTEEVMIEALAEASGLPWRRLDPLELDLKLVTRFFTRPFAQRHDCVVVGERADGGLDVAVCEPHTPELQESLRAVTGRPTHPVLATRSDIQKIINDFYGFRTTLLAAEREYRVDGRAEDIERLFLLKGDQAIEADDRHVVQAADYLLRHAVEQRASDIHLEPKRAEARVRYRIDGVLHTVHTIPRAVVPPLTSRLKMMARMDIAERRRPQDGRIKIAIRRSESGPGSGPGGSAARDASRDGTGEVEMRVSTMPTVFGEKVVIRIFDPEVLLQDLGYLGFTDEQRLVWQGLIARPHGIVLLTGPTGSGKTTTLYSSLRALATDSVNVVTIEDPIEMVTDLFNQVSVNPRVDVTFASALRTVLRQDPDIIMVGEIRDLDTARHAVQAALTGHLVFSTLHTNDAPTAFARLVDLGIEPFLVASTVIGVAAQRLVRRICPNCVETVLIESDEAEGLGLELEPGMVLPVQRGAGCIACRNTGYQGRAGVFELLPVDAAVRAAVHHGAGTDEVMRLARAAGMLTLREVAVGKLLGGETTREEVLRVTAAAH